MKLPFSQRTISSPYGWRRHPRTGVKSFHQGTDFRVPGGSAIRPLAAGTVAAKRRTERLGNTLTIDHGNGEVTKLFHMRHPSTFKVGDPVSERDVVGLVGDTGEAAFGDHLCLELWVKGRHVDVVEYIRGKA